jgi:hypothetical protein
MSLFDRMEALRQREIQYAKEWEAAPKRTIVCNTRTNYGGRWLEEGDTIVVTEAEAEVLLSSYAGCTTRPGG